MQGPGGETTSECEPLLAALFAVNWNKSKASVALHRSRMTLYRKVAKYHIERGAAQGGGLASILHDAEQAVAMRRLAATSLDRDRSLVRRRRSRHILATVFDISHAVDRER